MSNFEIPHLMALKELTGTFPEVNQTADELRAIDGLGVRQLRLSKRWDWNPPSILREKLEKAYRIGE